MIVESLTFLAYLAEPNSSLTGPIVDREALLPFAILPVVIQIVEHLSVSTPAPATLGRDPLAISPSPSLPGSASPHALFSQ